jgi:hypothetical protein
MVVPVAQTPTKDQEAAIIHRPDSSELEAKIRYHLSDPKASQVIHYAKLMDRLEDMADFLENMYTGQNFR